MKIFKLNFWAHFSNVIVILFCSVSYLILNNIVKNIILNFILVISTLFALVNLVNSLSLKHIVDENGLTMKGIFRMTSLRWEEIEFVTLKPTNSFFKPFIIVCGKNKTIGIWLWIVNYKNLLMYVIQKCKIYGRAKIDPDVDELLISFNSKT